MGAKALQHKLSEYLRLVAGGETVLVTDRDRVIAELVPPGADRASAVSDALLAEAVRAGLVRPPVLREEGAPPRLPVAPLAEILVGLDADRESR